MKPPNEVLDEVFNETGYDITNTVQRAFVYQAMNNYADQFQPPQVEKDHDILETINLILPEMTREELEQRFRELWIQLHELKKELDKYSDVKEVPDGFLKEMEEAYDRFVIKVKEQKWNTELRMEAENILVAFDQMYRILKGQ